MSDSENVVDSLISKADQAENADEALKFSQAALNAANAIAKKKESSG